LLVAITKYKIPLRGISVRVTDYSTDEKLSVAFFDNKLSKDKLPKDKLTKRMNVPPLQTIAYDK